MAETEDDRADDEWSHGGGEVRGLGRSLAAAAMSGAGRMEGVGRARLLAEVTGGPAVWKSAGGRCVVRRLWLAASASKRGDGVRAAVELSRLSWTDRGMDDRTDRAATTPTALSTTTTPAAAAVAVAVAAAATDIIDRAHTGLRGQEGKRTEESNTR